MKPPDPPPPLKFLDTDNDNSISVFELKSFAREEDGGLLPAFVSVLQTMNKFTPLKRGVCV